VANSYIANDYKVTSREIPLRDAKKSGALAFFEEKYGEKVRVVDIGDISKELCAGTHLAKIREIGTIKIISESSVASGIRRIEAVTAEFAERFIKDQQKKASEESQRKDKLKEQKNQEKKRNAEMDNIINQRLPAVIDKSVKVNGINTVFSLEDDLDMPALRSLADMVKEKLNQAVIVLGSKGQMQKNAFLVIAVSQDLLSRGLDAVALIRQVAGFIGGSGGGRKDFAQAGGANAENLTLAFDKLRDIINKLI